MPSNPERRTRSPELFRRFPFAFAFVCACACVIPLRADVRGVFANPPPETRVQFWYHWIGDCITEEGLVRDFRAMGEADVGTAHIFAPSMAKLPVKAKPMDAEWLRLFTVAIREAKRNNITLGFHNCPGWSSSGGPWITPENSMKKVVFSVSSVPGCRSTSGDSRGCGSPNCTETRISEKCANGKKLTLPRPPALRDFYRDIAVFAFPAVPDPTPVSSPFPLVANRAKGAETASGEIVFEKPFAPAFFTFRSEPLHFRSKVRVEALAEDGAWRPLAAREWTNWEVQPGTAMLKLRNAFPARRFRVTCALTQWGRESKVFDAALTAAPLLEGVDLCNSETSAMSPLGGDAAERGLDPARVADVSRFLAADGTFDLAAARAAKALPACGADEACRLVRIGCTTTGRGPAPATVRGLECDKLDRRGIDAHWAAMPAKILALPGAKDTVKYCIIDSYEVGGQNWSGILPREFAARRGYGIGKNLLVVCGYNLGTLGASRAFLRDWQRTIAELFAENYYDRFTELCHAAGVQSILEPYGGPFSPYRCGRSGDVPTGEFWLGGGTCGGSPRIAASLGHLNGRRRIATESFTTNAKEGRWQLTPHELRTVGDASGWLQGINQFVVHSYLHQAFPNLKPGLSLGHHGSQINVNTTWWPEMREWSRYVRRGQALLQYGRPHADVLVLGGGYQEGLFARGFDFDLCCEDDVLRLANVADGGVAAPGQLPYRFFVSLIPRTALRPETQRAVAALEKGGARVGWGNPIDAVKKFGLKPDFAAASALRATRREGTDGERIWFVVNMEETPFCGIADFAAPAGSLPEIFDAVTGEIRPVANTDGDGPGRVKVLLDLPAKGSAFVVFTRQAKRTLAEIPAALLHPEKLPVTVEKAVFRAIDDPARAADVTKQVRARVAAGGPFAASCSEIGVEDPASRHLKELVVTYRVGNSRGGGVPAAAGNRDNKGCMKSRGGEDAPAPAEAPAEKVFKEHESVSLAFYRPFVRPAVRENAADISDGWTITSFDGVCPPKAPLKFAKLSSWSLSDDPALRHFAGRAVYEKKIEGNGAKDKGRSTKDAGAVILDLGEVHEIANVWVNGKFLGCLWEPPYRIEIPSSILNPQPSTLNSQPPTLTPTLNLRIEVINTWPNRLIGDARARAARAAEPRGECGVPQWVLDGKPDSGTGIYTWSNFENGWKADEPLLPAGLLGPVRLLR